MTTLLQCTWLKATIFFWGLGTDSTDTCMFNFLLVSAVITNYLQLTIEVQNIQPTTIVLEAAVILMPQQDL